MDSSPAAIHTGGDSGAFFFSFLNDSRKGDSDSEVRLKFLIKFGGGWSIHISFSIIDHELFVFLANS